MSQVPSLIRQYALSLLASLVFSVTTLTARSADIVLSGGHFGQVTDLSQLQAGSYCLLAARSGGMTYLTSSRTVSASSSNVKLSSDSVEGSPRQIDATIAASDIWQLLPDSKGCYRLYAVALGKYLGQKGNNNVKMVSSADEASRFVLSAEGDGFLLMLKDDASGRALRYSTVYQYFGYFTRSNLYLHLHLYTYQAGEVLEGLTPLTPSDTLSLTCPIQGRELGLTVSSASGLFSTDISDYMLRDSTLSSASPFAVWHMGTDRQLISSEGIRLADLLTGLPGNKDSIEWLHESSQLYLRLHGSTTLYRPCYLPSSPGILRLIEAGRAGQNDVYPIKLRSVAPRPTLNLSATGTATLKGGWSLASLRELRPVSSWREIDLSAATLSTSTWQIELSACPNCILYVSPQDTVSLAPSQSNTVVLGAPRPRVVRSIRLTDARPYHITRSFYAPAGTIVYQRILPDSGWYSTILPFTCLTSGSGLSVYQLTSITQDQAYLAATDTLLAYRPQLIHTATADTTVTLACIAQIIGPTPSAYGWMATDSVQQLTDNTLYVLSPDGKTLCPPSAGSWLYPFRASFRLGKARSRSLRLSH